MLTGSQNLLLAEQVTESLAGRAAMLRLLPLARREQIGQPDTPLPCGMVEGIAALRNTLGAKVEPGWLVHPGDTQLPLGAGVRSIPFADL